MAYHSQYTYTDHQQRPGERQRFPQLIPYLDKAAGCLFSAKTGITGDYFYISFLDKLG
jgi:hypothetical protein